MTTTGARRARALERSKIAGAIGLLFGSLPVVSRLLFGAWAFYGAAEIACLFLIAAAYFYLVSRRITVLRDAAAMFEEAGELAGSGGTDRAIALLSKTIRENPRVWQAYQYRGQLHLQAGDAASALRDFSEAIRLAPEEAELRALRDHAQSLVAAPPRAS